MSSGSYAKLLEQKNVFTEEKGLTLTGLVWNTIMATFKFTVRTSVRCIDVMSWFNFIRGLYFKCALFYLLRLFKWIILSLKLRKIKFNQG